MLPLPNFLLEGQVAVVTGGGSGSGRAVAIAFAAAGAQVVVLDARAAAASQVADEIGISGQAITADVREADAIERAFADVALRYGHIDVLFNNAGINRRHPSLELTLDDWNAVVAVNMTGMFICARAAVRHMVLGGRIVNTASEGPLGIHEMMTAYGGAKGGVIGLTLALASEGPKYGIAVNGFSPRVGTRMSSPEIMSHVYSRPPESFSKLSTVFPPALASPAAVYLAHESCPLNGVMLCCGGGQILRMAIMQNDGFTAENLTMEVIAAHLDKIIDMSDAANVGVSAHKDELRKPKLAGGNKSSMDSIS